MIRPRSIARGVDLFPARTPTLPPATHTNSYAVGEREVLLIEPATPHEDEQHAWIEWARAFPSQGRQLVGVALTHYHPDHSGGAELLARELDLPIWAHSDTAERLPHLSIARLLNEGEVIVLDGEAPQRWRVLLTPGHAPGHVCFHDEDRGIAVVGDMVASVGTILINPSDGDMVEYLAQLDRLAALDITVALPAHGEPIEGDGKGAPSPTTLFRFYITHRLAREVKVHAALEQVGPEGASLSALLPLAYADTPVNLFPIARLSLEAHLVKLEREGRARRSGAGWARGG